MEYIQIQRSKVESNKWETMKNKRIPENLEELKKLEERLKGKAKGLEEKDKGYIYRVVHVEEIYKGDRNVD